MQVATAAVSSCVPQPWHINKTVFQNIPPHPLALTILWPLFPGPLALVLVIGIGVHLQLSAHSTILSTWTVMHLCPNHSPATRSFSDQGQRQHKSMDINTNIQKAVGNMTMQKNNSISPEVLAMFILKHEIPLVEQASNPIKTVLPLLHQLAHLAWKINIVSMQGPLVDMTVAVLFSLRSLF